MRGLAVLLALALLLAGCGRYGAPIRQHSLAPVSALPDRAAAADAAAEAAAEAEACEDTEPQSP